MKKRRKFTSEFKSKVALEALREQPPIHEIAKRYQIHPTQVTEWKKAFLSNAGSVFESASSKHDTESRLSSAIPVFSSNYVNHQPEQALSWIESLDVGPRHAALQFSFESLAVQNPELVIQWLNAPKVIAAIGNSPEDSDLQAHEVYDLLVTTFISASIRNQKNLSANREELLHSIQAVQNDQLKNDLTDLLSRIIATP